MNLMVDQLVWAIGACWLVLLVMLVAGLCALDKLVEDGRRLDELRGELDRLAEREADAAHARHALGRKVQGLLERERVVK